MSSKPLEVRVLITELPTLVEKESEQTDLNDTPEPMSLPYLTEKKVIWIPLDNQKFTIYYFAQF